MVNIPLNNQTETEEQQAKEFLSRVEVRTMKKDIQRLREGVALKERERIINLKTSDDIRREMEEKLQLENSRQEEIKKQARARAEILENKANREIEASDQLKEFAGEEEKQKIFYFESEKAELEKQLQAFQKNEEAPILLKKNRLMLEREAIEEKLKPILAEEKNIENEQKLVTETEEKTNVPSDKQKLEKKRSEIEDKREKIEIKRWETENELEKIEGQIKIADGEYQKLLDSEEKLKSQIEEKNNSLKLIYLGIMKREEEKKIAGQEQAKTESLNRAEAQRQKQEEIRRQEWNKKEEPVGIGDRKENLIKKIRETSEKEKEARKKFLQNIAEREEEEKKQG